MAQKLIFRGLLTSVLVVASVGCAAPSHKEPVEADVATDEAALSITLSPTKGGQSNTVSFDGKTKWYGYKFHGAAHEKISIYAQANKGDVDPVLYLYKVSKTTGRTTGSALAVNDDTATTGILLKDTDASIDGFVLPLESDYAILVRGYDLAERGLLQVWYTSDVAPLDKPATFPASGSGIVIPEFTQTDARETPISKEAIALQDKAAANGLVLVPARVQLDAAKLKALVADATAFRTFAYDMMYYAGAKPFGSSYPHFHGPATVTSIAAADALKVLAKATVDFGSSDAQPLGQLERQLVESMLGDGAFATKRVQVFQVHWDNADDTNAESILAVDVASGESRAVTFVNPP